jgi:hypothetical protein
LEKHSEASKDTPKQKKTHFVVEVLTQKDPIKEDTSVEEKEKKPAAMAALQNGDEVEDPMKNDPKFRIVKCIHRADAQLTLTQYWPGDSTTDT